jgi:hypothetical protein
MYLYVSVCIKCICILMYLYVYVCIDLVNTVSLLQIHTDTVSYLLIHTKYIPTHTVTLIHTDTVPYKIQTFSICMHLKMNICRCRQILKRFSQLIQICTCKMNTCRRRQILKRISQLIQICTCRFSDEDCFLSTRCCSLWFGPSVQSRPRLYARTQGIQKHLVSGHT